MRSNIDAFNAFIEQAKEHYATLITAQSWDADIWTSEGDFSGNSPTASLHFTKILKSKHINASVINNRNYINWCKAVTTMNVHKMVFASLQRNIKDMKYLHQALLHVKGAAEPRLLDDAVLEQLETNLIASGYMTIYKLLNSCLKKTMQLKAMAIIHVGITFTHTHKQRPNTEQKALNQRRKKAQSIDDNERDGEDKLLSMKALHSLAWLTLNASNSWEQVALRLYHILMVTGFRIGELLRVRHDALISVAEINETTGKPIFVEKRDEDGKVVLNDNGKPELEPQLIWGIHYYPEKGHIAAYKWLDPTSAPLVIAAFEFINKQTATCREQLKWLEQNPTAPIRWESKTMTFRDINEHFVNYVKEPNENVITNFTSRLKKAGVLSVGSIVDQARITITRRLQNMPLLKLFRVADMNRYYQQSKGDNHYTSISFEMGGNGKRKKTITIKKSELLCIAPSGALASLTDKSTVSHLYPEIFNASSMAIFFGLLRKNTSPLASIFSRYGLKEDDGSNIKIESHMPRHQLNTFLALADVAEHQQALIVGRRDIEQNRAYQHLSLKDKTKYQGTSTESMRQRAVRAQQTNEIVAPPEPEDNLLAELGVAPIGATPTKLAVQQDAHAFNKPAEHVEFMQEALEQDNLLGELQNNFNEIRQKDGLQAAKEFIEVHGRNFHIVINGGCTRNLALHGCDKQLRCLDGEGCFHLTITGRPGELDSIQSTHQNLSLNVDKMSRLAQSGKLKSRREREAFEIEKHNLAQMDIVLCKAENFSGFIPIRVFETTKRLNMTGPKKTVVENFAQDQRKLKEEVKNG
ncbi:hypothetical protein [Moritella sp.]|uniref:hypothetical protein n=1 Tax=Moritella sp. TaxID=78556 RepID=UPI001E073269|nr:hypothetical protein [Moritella sp.]MCJ8350873.1 hypothetical protein [Moritella sp.]NQZ40439.1 hypothetical protein [Moritella sp.]